MSEIATTASWFLAVVLLWAAWSKMTDLNATKETFRELGVRVRPRWVVVLEVAIGLGLLFRPRPTGAIAFAVLGAFTFVVMRAGRRPEPVRCSCFGSASSAPIDASTVVRNVMLSCVAVVALGTARPNPSVPGLIGGSVGIAVGSVGLALVRLRIQVGRIFPAIDRRGDPVVAPSTMRGFPGDIL